ncbi:hypothetical protein CAC42_6461 [Sphaceloma murrayae]|uniref:Zn(2)-C6 fungal-type domain-containing protein n=1 Tax=Sphaceloma murrayae TaxID=2082308 RepID=A0A2K1QMH4_9PEZI|nr:hypothetical protein CAC42_6461 [Sphaceloma murrayae]
MSDTSIPEKKRLTRRRGACVRCKHKKIRCNGGQPRCNQCKTDESCTYMPNPARRRIKKHYRPSGQLATLRPLLLPDNHYFDASVASLGQPEFFDKHPQQCHPTLWDGSLSPLDCEPESDLTPLHFFWPLSGSLADTDLLDGVFDMSAGEDVPDLTHSITPPLGPISRQLSLSESSSICDSSIGSSSAVDFTLPSASVDATLIGEVVQSISMQPQPFYQVTDLLRALKDAYAFMDRAILPDATLSSLTIEALQEDLKQPEIDDYILEYFAAQTMQHVSQTRILALKSQALAGSLAVDDDSIALIYCAIAIGCRLRRMKDRRCRILREPDFYYKRALLWLPRLTSEPPSFSKVQALLPMIMYAKSTLCTNFSRYLISEALRIAFALRLNLLAGSTEGGPLPEHVSHERMAFIMLYTWEKPLSMRFNTQSAIDDDYIAFDLEGVATKQTPSLTHRVVHDLIFARICSRVSKELCSPKALRNTEQQQSSIRNALQSSLEDWFAAAPSSDSSDVEELEASIKFGEGTFVLQDWSEPCTLSACRRVLRDVTDLSVQNIDEESLSALLTSFTVVLHCILVGECGVTEPDDKGSLVAACGKMAEIARHNKGFNYAGFVRVCASLHEGSSLTFF